MENKDFSEHGPPCIIFYPLSCNDFRLNGIGITDNSISLSDLFSIADFSLIKFFDEEIFFFQKKYTKIEEQPFIYQGRFLYNEEIRKMSEFFAYKDTNGNLNFLKHITLKSKKMKEEEKNCLQLAIDSGFPDEQFIDFETKKLVDNKYILQKWEAIIRKKRWNLEKNFVNTVSSGIKAILDEYSDLFNSIEIISEENHFSSLDLLIAVTELPFFSPSERMVLPKIFFKKVTIKMIVHINGDFLDNLCKRIESEFEKYGYNIGYRFYITEKRKIGDQTICRTKIILLVTFPEFISLNDIKYCLINFKNEVLDILEEVDSDSYKNFLSRITEEIWIKKIDIYILVSTVGVETVRNLVGEYFHGIQKRFLVKHLNEENSAVKITLTLNRFSDYSLSERSKIYNIEYRKGITLKEIYNPLDKYTRIAIEDIYAKNFGEAFEYLRKAEFGLLGDFYSIKYLNTDSKRRFHYNYKALNCYEKAGIERHAGYMDDLSEEIVRKALKVNGWWRVSLKQYLRARDIIRQRDWDKTVGDQKVRKVNKKLLRKYRALQSRRNMNDFSRVMGDFYKTLLLETQEECKDFTKKVLGYAI